MGLSRVRLWILAASLQIAYPLPLDVHVSIDLQHVIHVTDERFLSVVMGPTVIRHNWDHFNMSSPRVHTLAKALAPAIFRVGGNEADLLIFGKNAESASNTSQLPETNWPDYSSSDDTDWYDDDLDYDSAFDASDDPKTNFIMTAHQWDQLNEFTASVGWNLLFDLNVLLRRGEEWDSSNALELIQYSIQHNYTWNLNFELGNEPNAFKHYINRTVDPTQLGKDFLQLHYIMRQSSKFSPYFNRSLLVGPDTTRPTSDHAKVLVYLRKFLKVAGESLSAITWHQYYMDGRDAKAADFINPDLLDLLPQQAARVKAVIEELGLQHKPLMMGETGSCWGGGAPHLSNRYAGGFLWLDKLGVAARMGHSVVMRQTFYEGNYGMIGPDLLPTPDYWLSLLYKVLVGTRVLHVTNDDPSRRVRVYTHCTALSRSLYPKGSITVYALNLHTFPVQLVLPPDLSSKMKHIYWFTPYGNEGFSSKYVNINGKKMELINDVTFPKVIPMVTNDTKIMLPQTSFGYIVIPEAGVPVCM